MQERRGEQILALASRLGAAEAADLHAALLGLDPGLPLTLDGSRVERLATPGLQVLFAAQRAWAAAGSVFALHGATPALGRALAACGATALLAGGSPGEGAQP